MPTLPLDHPDPLAATLGVMLYPCVTTEEQEKAAAFPIKLLARAGAFKPEHADSLLENQLRELIDSGGGTDTPDAGDRFHYGSAVGLMVQFYHALAMSGDPRASWATAQTIVLRNTGRPVREGISDSQLKQQRHRFMSVAHLWGAYAYRDFCFITDDRVGYGLRTRHSAPSSNYRRHETGDCFRVKCTSFCCAFDSPGQSRDFSVPDRAVGRRPSDPAFV